MAEQFDLIIIGAGPGGYSAAIRASQLGLKVACVEKRTGKALGGTCLNVGCIPSKALLDSSELYETTTQKLSKHGITAKEVTLNVEMMMNRKNDVVKTLTGGIAGLFKKYKVTPYYGSASLIGDGRVDVTNDDSESTSLKADKILLATGSISIELPFLKYDGNRVVSSTEALDFTEVPKHLVIVGGGYIGLELGSVWQRLGSKVTVVEFLPRILANSDGEVANAVHKILKKQGFEFHMETKVTGAKVTDNGVTVEAETKDGEKLSFDADKVLVAVGRRPYTQGLNLDKVGVELDQSGKVKVDTNYRTNVEGIYAIGDIIAGPMLAHKASEEGVVLAEQLAGSKVSFDVEKIPSVIYIWPEVASVGPTEEQIKATNKNYKVGKFPFAASGRARAMDEIEGFVKVITDAETDRLLAVHILGPRASELIAECVTIMEYHGSAEDIARCTHSHPTLSEAVGEAARAAWAGSPINM